jgi:hypothetical protein
MESVPANIAKSPSDLSQDLTRAARALEDIRASAVKTSIMTGLPPVMFGAGGPM